jgi:small subunit ribosomal protein S20
LYKNHDNSSSIFKIFTNNTMANSAQARKRARQAEKHRIHNKSRKSAVRTAIKKVIATIQDGNKEEAQNAYQSMTSIIDKAVKVNLVHRNNAARQKSRLSARIKAM